MLIAARISINGICPRTSSVGTATSPGGGAGVGVPGGELPRRRCRLSARGQGTPLRRDVGQPLGDQPVGARKVDLIEARRPARQLLEDFLLNRSPALCLGV